MPKVRIPFALIVPILIGCSQIGIADYAKAEAEPVVAITYNAQSNTGNPFANGKAIVTELSGINPSVQMKLAAVSSQVFSDASGNFTAVFRSGRIYQLTLIINDEEIGKIQVSVPALSRKQIESWIPPAPSITSGTGFTVSFVKKEVNPAQGSVPVGTYGGESSGLKIFANVTGLLVPGTGVSLKVNSGSVTTVNSNSSQQSWDLSSGESYNVTIDAQPAGAGDGVICNIANPTGTVSDTDVTIDVTCPVIRISGIYYDRCLMGMNWQANSAGACDGTYQVYSYCNNLDNSCNGGTDTGSLQDVAASPAFQACKTSNRYGLTNWRVPTPAELNAIVDAGEFPQVNPNYFFGTDPAGHWTSQSVSPTQAARIDFASGATANFDKTNQMIVRCVATP